MKTYKAIRTGQLVTVLKEENDQVTIQLENGETKDVTKSTLSRWYKPCEDEPTLAEPEVAVESETPVEPEPTPEPVKASKKAVTTPKEKPAKKDPKPLVAASKDTAIRAYLEAQAKALGYELYSGKVKVFVAIKHEGSTLFAYTYSTTGVTLWVRSSALKGVECTYETKNHMFDARATLRSDSPTNRQIIDQLLVNTRKEADDKKAAKVAKTAK